MRPFIIVFASALLMFSPFSDAMADGGDDPIAIFIEDGGSNDYGPTLRIPAIIPMESSYYPSLSTIMVNFRWDLGSVSVEIENLSTQEYWQTTINATQGVHPFLISGTSGTWTITFTLSNGTVYYGEFNL